MFMRVDDPYLIEDLSSQAKNELKFNASIGRRTNN
jgi:hypothetical protein